VFHGLGCIILDLRMHGLSGIDLQERLSQAGTALPIVFLTGHGDIPTGVKAMKKGAVDFLTKPVDEDSLLNAVELALDRHRAVLHVLAERHELEERYARLTPREREVMAHVVAGKLNKQTAADLGISLKTAKVHRGRVMAKMEAESLADLVRMAERLDSGPAKG
jgi:FixJ family two-component response regulator